MKDLLLSGLILFTIDIIWIKLFMGGHFQKLIKNIDEQMTVKTVPAFFAYLFLVIAFYYFIILEKKVI